MPVIAPEPKFLSAAEAKQQIGFMTLNEVVMAAYKDRNNPAHEATMQMVTELYQIAYPQK